jgi:uncharacterized protein YxjI
MKKLQLLLALSVFLFISSNIFPQGIPGTINYQGVLKDAAGVVVPDGNYNITFRIYTTLTAGSPLWEEAHLAATTGGVLNVILGSVVPLTIPFDDQYFLGITVGAGSELTPRIPFTASAYSLNSVNAEKVNNIEANITPTPNTLLPLDNNGKFPTSVVSQIKMNGVKGTANINLTSTSNVEILALTISDLEKKDVFLTGDVVVEINGIVTSDRYEFTIRKGSINGPMLGRGWWRVTTSVNGLVAQTISFSAIDKDVTGAETYYLVGRKYDTASIDALVFIYSLNSIYTLK